MGDELVVERTARDRRPTSAILEAWFRARAHAALDAAIGRPCAGARGDAGQDHHPRHDEPVGELLPQGQPVLLPGARPRAAGGARLGRGPRGLPPAGVRAWTRFVSLLSSRVPDRARVAAMAAASPAELHAALD
jgi:hypothetical protein